MAAYPQLPSLVGRVRPPSAEADFNRIVVPYLVDVWLGDYGRTNRSANVVETEDAGFRYLFDLTDERLVAAWGISRGRHGAPRDHSRMRGHPLGAGPLYHRGHAIPHTLGGPTDINLVAQLGRINIGPFRPLERQAVATPDAFYFTYWSYRGAARAPGGLPGQRPTSVDQGLLVAGQPPLVDVRTHRN